jgi:two-component system chemotaxis sensor kinase CheA
MSSDVDPMAEIRASFFIECEELLEALNDGLQSLENGEAGDTETINILFRAVHSIKGGAGAFGLEALVRFAHRYETALDEVRGGRMSVREDAMRLFFQAADHLSDLVRISRDEVEMPEARSLELLEQLDALIGEKEGEDEQEIDVQPTGLSLDLDLGDLELPDLDPGGGDAGIEDASGPDFRILFKPQAELFEMGNEPFTCCAHCTSWASARSASSRTICRRSTRCRRKALCRLGRSRSKPKRMRRRSHPSSNSSKGSVRWRSSA